MNKLISFLAPCTLGLAVMLGADTASAADDRVHVYGSEFCGMCGDYVQTGEMYEGHPVYVFEDNASIRMYRQLSGSWVIDSNWIGEDQVGVIATGPDAEVPFGSLDHAGMGVIPTDVVHVASNTYSDRATGSYYHEGDCYNGKPVFVHTDQFGLTWSLYQRADDAGGPAAGAWVIDFNDVDDEWSGTINWATSATEWPWEAAFSDDTATTAIAEIDVADAPYSNATTGIFTFAFESYNGKPVYERQVGASTWSIYRRSGGYAADAWVIDFDDVDDEWSGTVSYGESAAEWPWETAFNNSTVIEPVED